MNTTLRFVLLSSLSLLVVGAMACGNPDPNVGDGTGGAANAGGGGMGGKGTKEEGCDPQTPCGADAWCDYADDRCGGGVKTGTCHPRPRACSGGSAAHRCGCDGKLYDEDGSTPNNSCFVTLAGVDLAIDGRCDMPGWLSCGSQLIEPGVEGFYCMHFPKRAGTEAEFALGQVLGSSVCPNGPTCDCLAALSHADPGAWPCSNATHCSVDAAGHITLTCP